MNKKQAARDWREEQSQNAKLEALREREMELLWYAANKRKTGYPSVSSLRECGLNEAADLLRQAYDLIEEAHSKAVAGL
jgi:cellobiose-specific phosphotransferase system component IIA